MQCGVQTAWLQEADAALSSAHFVKDLYDMDGRCALYRERNHSSINVNIVDLVDTTVAIVRTPVFGALVPLSVVVKWTCDLRNGRSLNWRLQPLRRACGGPYNDQWGTVCDDYWDLTDATVVCRQLGYQQAEEALRYAYFGPGSGPIWMDDVHCVGHETSLDQCPHNGIGLHNCGHGEDASVRCTAPVDLEIVLHCEASYFQVDIPTAFIGDINYSTRYYSYPVEATLGTDLYFRAELVKGASNLEIHLRSCRATPSPDYDDAVVYEFIRDGCGVNNAAVRVLTPESPTQADFEIASFRFRQDLGSATSQVWVHCEVILCDVTDAFSECSQGCEVGRHRRSVDTPYGKPTRIMQGPIKLWESKTVAESGHSSDEVTAGSSTFMVAISALCVVLTVGLVMMSVVMGVFYFVKLLYAFWKTSFTL
ncbi:putative deleted in malignant brain tumors 1 protein isoform X5 [Apostichopus japonicus]|uniref:Putative deleted in malignant brain tumors 1 protein isoform X5 n=1 Tax=Stichopus japonicus TaxID=307972 RepID=A0A2G8KSP5_STIJA|nr:putative deleted in malignant brain tumors 1 protein isoform X5 [Apostichopus japonicus]